MCVPVQPQTTQRALIASLNESSSYTGPFSFLVTTNIARDNKQVIITGIFSLEMACVPASNYSALSIVCKFDELIYLSYASSHSTTWNAKNKGITKHIILVFPSPSHRQQSSQWVEYMIKSFPQR